MGVALIAFGAATLFYEGIHTKETARLGPTLLVLAYAAFAFTLRRPNDAGILHMDIGDFVGNWVDDSFTRGAADETWDPVIGYFVEYDVVPEPSTALTLGVGIAAMGLKRRKRIR